MRPCSLGVYAERCHEGPDGLLLLPSRWFRSRRAGDRERARVHRRRRHDPGAGRAPTSATTRSAERLLSHAATCTSSTSRRRSRASERPSAFDERRGRADARLLRGPAESPGPRLRDCSTTSASSSRSRPGPASWPTRERADADLLYLHHLTPINEAALASSPDIPVIGHIHGSELLMLERIAAGAPAELGAGRRVGGAHLPLGCRVRADRRQQPGGPSSRGATCSTSTRPLRRSSPTASTRRSSRATSIAARHWRRHLVESPQGWRPDERARERQLRRGGPRALGRARPCSTAAASPRSSACRS